ncbi:interleukin-1 beta [Hippopotamus amphibius kiboko]|uniref:interleukin-1 beta n=1 Tax=Hippopotamus amphibius kiboko TaxID=575201 RepID=UPI002591F981|nr:interleukin-1 beta [Hippopotamus amphibius kiboko]XP_057597737.1 interleukin-1 beta [Hippopotamus amphibius kiboko]
MARVPEPANEVMSYYSNEDDLLFEADGPKQMKCCVQHLDIGSTGDGSIRLQISHQLCNKSLRQVVSVIVAMEKLRKVSCSQAFHDDDLRSIFSLIFEEEPIIFETYDDELLCDAGVQSLKCKLHDKDQKSLVLASPYVLKALHLHSRDMSREVVFCMSFVQGDESDDKIPVALGLKEKNLYLSCVMKGDTPTLQLEEVDPKIYPKWKMEKRFVFNKTEIKDRVEFESALYPNWYISTSQAEEKPIFLGPSKGGHDITDFTMEVVSP